MPAEVSDSDDTIYDVSERGPLSDSESPYFATTEPSEPGDNAKISISTVCAKLSVTVEPVVLLYFMGASMTIPLTQQLLYALISQRMNITSPGNSPQCDIDTTDPQYLLEQQAQATASEWMMTFVAASIIPAFFTTIFLGAYSDRAGRKLGIIMPVAGATMRSLWSIAVMFCGWPVAALLVGVFIDGFCGGIGTLTMSCFTYISDITIKAQRSFRIVVVEITIAIGITLSQLASGYLITYSGYKSTLVVVVVIFVVTFIYATTLRETVKSDITQPFFRLRYLKSVYQLYTTDNHLRRCKLALVLSLLYLTCIAEFGASDVLTLTLLNSPLCWTSIQIGYFFAASCVLRSSGGIVTTELLSPYMTDISFVTMACASGILYNIVLASARDIVQVYLGIIKYSTGTK